MIFDELANAQTYSSLHPGFALAFAFLSNPGMEDLPVGRYEIDGDRIYAMVQRGPGRAREEAFLETHDRYIDIQLVLDGTDEMGWKPRSRCVEVQREYDAATDVAFYLDIPAVWVAVEQGMFAVFFPEDAHLPSISSEEIHKVVVKIRLASPEHHLP